MQEEDAEGARTVEASIVAEMATMNFLIRREREKKKAPGEPTHKCAKSFGHVAFAVASSRLDLSMEDPVRSRHPLIFPPRGS